jgi:C1A family cysteine protease
MAKKSKSKKSSPSSTITTIYPATVVSPPSGGKVTEALDVRLDRVQRSPHDPRDHEAETIYQAINLNDLPDNLDYRPELLPIRDQGKQGCCFGMSSAAMKEWQERRDVHFLDYMSPQFIYNSRSTKGEGMYPRDVMRILTKVGSVPEKDYPYLTTLPITEALKKEASEYRVQGYAVVKSIDALKKALVKNGPCLLTIPVYNYGPRMWKQANDKQALLGYHATCIVGYLKDKGGFIVRNSWGKRYADNGYTYFPYEDWGLQSEVWTTVDSESGKPLPSKKKKKAGFFERVLDFVKNLF